MYPRLRASSRGVGAETQPDLGGDDLVDDGLVLPLVDVVDELGALVTEIAGVFEPDPDAPSSPIVARDPLSTTVRSMDGISPVLDTLESTFRSLSALGAGLSEDQWKTATDLPAWTVQDNLSHLVAIERVLQGHDGTAHRATETGHVRKPIGESNENEVDARRSLSGAAVLAEWDAIVAERMATLRLPTTSTSRSGDDPTGPGTLADFLHIRILDCWLHEQDMRRALGLPGHQDGPAAEHTIDRLIRTIGIVVGKRADTPEGDTVVIDLTGPVHRTITATVVDGRAQVSTDRRPHPRIRGLVWRWTRTPSWCWLGAAAVRRRGRRRHDHRRHRSRRTDRHRAQHDDLTSRGLADPSAEHTASGGRIR